MVGPGGVMIKSAKVTKAPMMTGGNQHQVQQRGDDGQLGSGQIQGIFTMLGHQLILFPHSFVFIRMLLYMCKIFVL